jgi:hypothetical protein
MCGTGVFGRIGARAGSRWVAGFEVRRSSGGKVWRFLNICLDERMSSAGPRRDPSVRRFGIFRRGGNEPATIGSWKI